MLEDETITHCDIQIADSVITLGTAIEGPPRHGLGAQLFVEASNGLLERAVPARECAMRPMTDTFFDGRLIARSGGAVGVAQADRSTC
jgi:hypothetical protein